MAMNMNIPYSANHLDVIVEKNVIELLSVILHQYGRMHCSKLVELFISMCDNVMNQFSHFSQIEVLSFTERFPSLFSAGSQGFISVTRNADVYSMNINSIEECLAVFLYSFLQSFDFLHFSLLCEAFLRFWQVVKDILSSLPPEQHVKYFLKRPDFKVASNGYVEVLFMYVSGISNVDAVLGQQNVRKVNEFLRKIIKISDTVHYLVVLDYACQNMPDVCKFFSGISLQGKFWYFRNRPKLFYIRRNGYLIHKQRAEKEVVAFLKAALQEHGRIHYAKLLEMLKNTSSDISEFFDGYSEFEIGSFFKMHKKEFIIDADSCEYIGVANTSAGIDHHSKLGHVSQLSLGTGQEMLKKVPDEGSVVRILSSILGNKRMHYRKLLLASFKTEPSLLRFFELFPPSEEFSFFKKHSDIFFIGGDGYVTTASFGSDDSSVENTANDLNCTVVSNCSSRENDTVSSIPADIKEHFLNTVLISHLTEILKGTENNQAKILSLYNMVRAHNVCFVLLLEDLTVKDLKAIIRGKPEMFIILDVDTVCLNPSLSKREVPLTIADFKPDRIECLQGEESSGSESTTSSYGASEISEVTRQLRSISISRSLASDAGKGTGIEEKRAYFTSARSIEEFNEIMISSDNLKSTLNDCMRNTPLNNSFPMIPLRTEFDKSLFFNQTCIGEFPSSCTEQNTTEIVSSTFNRSHRGDVGSNTDSIDLGPTGDANNSLCIASSPYRKPSSITSECKSTQTVSNTGNVLSPLQHQSGDCPTEQASNTPSSSSGRGSEKCHTCFNPEVCQYFVDAVNAARDEVRSAKCVLMSFLDLCGSVQESCHEGSSLVSSHRNMSGIAKGVLEFYSEMECRSIEFFKRILHNSVVPVLVPDLQLFLLAAPDDVRSYLGAHYGFVELDNFFKRNASHFSVDSKRFVSLK